MSLYRIFDVEQHSTTKNVLLKEIEEAYGYECTTTDFKGDYLSFISKSNWNKSDLISPTSKICWPYFLTTEDNFSFQDFLKKEYGNMGNQWRVESQWYNQYESNSGSDHPWHNHEYSNSFGEDILTGSLTCIYYLEVIDESLMTVLKHPETGEEVIPEVKEGQILTMDGKIFHKSPRNFTNTRKTVISFNIIFR